MRGISIDFLDVNGEQCIANRSQHEHRERLIARQNETRNAQRAAAARAAKRYQPQLTADDVETLQGLARTFAV